VSVNMLCLASSHKLPGAAKPNVVVRVRRRIVQIQSKDPGVRAIVPIATTAPGQRARFYPFLSIFKFLETAQQFSHFRYLLRKNSITFDTNEFQILG